MQQRGRKSRAQLAVTPVNRPATGAEPPQTPAHLGEPERQIWVDIFSEFDLPTDTAAHVLASALEAHMRARLAGEAIARDGMVTVGRDGQPRAHSLLSVERDARAAFLAGLKALAIDFKPPKESRIGGVGWLGDA